MWGGIHANPPSYCSRGILPADNKDCWLCNLQLHARPPFAALVAVMEVVVVDWIGESVSTCLSW